MALKLTSISTFLLLSSILAMAASNAQAARVGPTKPNEKGEMKKPDCIQEGSMLIPSVGRYMPSHHASISAEIPRYGDLGANTGRQYIPGGDDTLVPNPGFEVPIPGSP